MNQPRFHLLPLRHAAPKAGGTLPFVLRIVPPQPAASSRRPPLNLALVIDRSGSMSGAPLEHAKRAAATVVSALRPEDRVAVVAYDDSVQLPVPSTLATDPGGIRRAIASLRSGGSTALHDGWVAGGQQVGLHLDPTALNRVILLSDGQANVGVRDPATLGDHCAGLFERGISTSTLGLGRSFNEDLLVTMAERGGGNYFFVESPDDLVRIFAEELDGLVATYGIDARLDFRSGVDARIERLLNELPRRDDGFVLPDLVAGLPLEVGGELLLPPLTGDAALLGEFVIAWRAPDGATRHESAVPLQLPLLEAHAYAAFPEDDEVRAILAELEAAHLKERAVAALDSGDRAGVASLLRQASAILQAAPASPRTERELEDLDLLDQTLQADDTVLFRKHGRTQAYRTKRGRGRRS
jgi:Ca-activated chloride channel family protein